MSSRATAVSWMQAARSFVAMGEEHVRIGIVIGQLTHGGAERQVVELAHGLRLHTAFEAVVVCYTMNMHPFGEQLASLGVRVVHPRRRLRRGLETAIWLRTTLQKERCALAYALLSPANVYCALACAGSHVRFVASIRGLPELTGALRLGLRWAYGRADGLIANSASGAAWAVGTYGACGDRVTVVPNAVSPVVRDPESRSRLRRDLGVPDGAQVVGTVANLKQQKNPGFFLDMAQRVLAQKGGRGVLLDSGAVFVWVGDGPLQRAMAERRSRLGAAMSSRIHFVGAKDDVPAWLSLFDIFVLTSSWEGLPGALMEAMSAGLPCVATDVPGTRDLGGHGQNLLLVPLQRDVFAQELLRLLDSRMLQAQLGENASREMRDRYSRKALAQRTAAVLSAVLPRHADNFDVSPGERETTL